MPQSVHFSGSILEMSWPPPAMMAPWGHSLEQALHVMQFSVILCGTVNLRNSSGHPDRPERAHESGRFLRALIRGLFRTKGSLL